ncbi:winged helix-turn-helix domain-containing protein [Brevibacillus sp. SYSU BS000544]|uniref:winged helix-turn-helix domain-containing protein n=1 Tax=Brevibacillus sp. SYSU BS000544 TaxID=3416443 RepID=UPI003CE4EAD3
MIAYQLSEDRSSISIGEETIPLLPKEFALLQFFIRNKDRTFTREELLDAVWKREEPTDRTVDDHIYRLRKKLHAWQHLFKLETVRGQGYRLRIIERPSLRVSPIEAPEFDRQIQQLFETYHRFGMGAAMETLYANQKTLGIQIPRFYSSYLHFVRGDFHWLIDTAEISYSEKLFFLVHIFASIHEDVQTSIRLFHQTLASNLLEHRWQRELSINCINLYLEAGLLSEARERLDQSWVVVNEANLPVFELLLLQKEVIYFLLKSDLESAEKMLITCEQKVSQLPYHLQKASVLILRGWLALLQNHTQDAKKLIAQGVALYQQSRFVPHLIFGVRLILRYIHEPTIQRTYLALWKDLARQHDFPAIEKKLSQVLSL